MMVLITLHDSRTNADQNPNIIKPSVFQLLSYLFSTLYNGQLSEVHDSSSLDLPLWA